jgi:hypothetical protein
MRKTINDRILKVGTKCEYHSAIMNGTDYSFCGNGVISEVISPKDRLYRVVENDKTLKFNGKNYAISNEGSYKNLIEEVIIHNKFLQDIISHIDKNPDTAESTKPTTVSLI